MVMDSSQDKWRTEINLAARDFASAAASLEDEELRAFFNTMLREIGESLRLDCCALVDAGEQESTIGSGYAWCSTSEPFRECPFQSAAFARLLNGLELARQPMVIDTAAADVDDGAMASVKASLRGAGLGTALLLPIATGKRATGAWLFGAIDTSYVFAEPVVEHLQTVGDLVSAALRSRWFRPEAAEQAPMGATPVSRLPLKARPARAWTTGTGVAGIVGESAALKAALASLDEVAEADCTVLLLGETGTGKELFARALHGRGPRAAFSLVSVNCAALPPTLIESELFGHQRGAFTGAIAPRQGRFELAHRGTLFLDEIGDLPIELQAKLLRVLQEGAFERVGASQTQAVDVRIIGATHQDLPRAVAEGAFRADLYYRLNVFPIRLPPLRERREDIPALVWAFIRKRQVALRRHVTSVLPETMAVLQQHSWPGNIRELENVVERALIHSTGDTLELLDPNLALPGAPPVADTLTSVERAHIQGVLRDCGWRINGMGNAAERLGLHPNTLRFRMKKLGIVRLDAPSDLSRVRQTRAWAG